ARTSAVRLGLRKWTRCIHQLRFSLKSSVLPDAHVVWRQTPETQPDRKRSMKTEDLRAIQAPIKERYKGDPDAALITLSAEGRLGEGITCNVQTGKALVAAGLHPATGGNGQSACSGDMLLEALVACAGVTLN